jgi:hypothetical protein
MNKKWNTFLFRLSRQIELSNQGIYKYIPPLSSGSLTVRRVNLPIDEFFDIPIRCDFCNSILSGSYISFCGYPSCDYCYSGSKIN